MLHSEVAGAAVALLCSNYLAPAAPRAAAEGGGSPPIRRRCGLPVASVVAAAGLLEEVAAAEGLPPLLQLLILTPTQPRRTWPGLSRALAVPPAAGAVFKMVGVERPAAFGRTSCTR